MDLSTILSGTILLFLCILLVSWPVIIKIQVDSKRENKDESNMFKENINDKPESKS